MAPGNRHLVDPIAKLTGDEQDLYVEPEAIQPLQTEDTSGALVGEAFQTTLRVLNARDGQELDESVEHAPHEVAVVRLSDSTRTHSLARRNDYVVIAEHRAQSGQIVGGHRQVRVAKEHSAASSSLYAAANGRPLARVSSHEQLDTRVTLRLDTRHVARFVGATIVHHDNLVSEAHRGQVPAYLL